MNKKLNKQYVKKKWGNEFWIVNIDKYCGKKLILKKGFQCSLHFHKKKEETFFVQEGLVYMETNRKNWLMIQNDIQHITPGTTHRFTGIEDSIIFEFSTHHDDEDSYRLLKSRQIPDSEFCTLYNQLIT